MEDASSLRLTLVCPPFRDDIFFLEFLMLLDSVKLVSGKFDDLFFLVILDLGDTIEEPAELILGRLIRCDDGCLVPKLNLSIFFFCLLLVVISS